MIMFINEKRMGFFNYRSHRRREMTGSLQEVTKRLFIFFQKEQDEEDPSI